MPNTLVKSRWVAGALEFLEAISGDQMLLLDPTNHLVKIGANMSLGLGADTISVTELGFLDGITAGSITASKAVTRDAGSRIPFATASPAAAGNSAGTATAITADVNEVTNSDGTTGVILPVGVAGMRIKVVNSVTTVTAILKVYPDTGGQINGGGANVAANVGPGMTAEFVCTAALTWQMEKIASILNYAEIALLTGITAASVTASKAVTRDAGSRIPRLTAVVAAAGNATGNATLLAAEVNVVTGADAAVGVRLPVVTDDIVIKIINTGAAVLKVYPDTGGQINAAGADVALSMAANSEADFVCTAALTWYCPTATAGVTSGVAGVAAGYKIARSAAAVAVTGTLDVDTGLTTVLGWGVTMEDDPDGPALAAVSAAAGAAGHITIKCWKTTTGGVAGNADYIAATAAKNVRWVAVGS